MRRIDRGDQRRVHVREDDVVPGFGEQRADEAASDVAGAELEGEAAVGVGYRCWGGGHARSRMG